MTMIRNTGLLAALVFSMALSACASSDYASQLSQPNFGRRLVPSVNLDPTALMYGPLAPRPSQVPCYTADNRCSPQLQLLWADSAPR